MNKIEITPKQVESTIALFLSGSSLVTGGFTAAKQNTWFCIMVAAVLVIPMLWVHTQILTLYPGRNYLQNTIRAVGRPLGLVICLLMLLYSLMLGGSVLITFSAFVQIINMTETPLIAIAIAILAVAVYVLNSRLYVLARLSKFVLPFLYITVFLTLLLAYRDIDFDNLKPVLQMEPEKLALGSMSAFTLPYGEIIICMPLFGEMDQKEKIFPPLFKGVIIGFIIIITANLRNVLILGYSTAIYLFPSFEAVSVIQLGEFFNRIEVLIGINLLLAGFFKTGILLFFTCDCLRSLAGYKDYEPLIAPASLGILTVSMMLYKNTEELEVFLKDIFPIISIPVQVLLPILVLIVSKVRKKFQKPRLKSVPQKAEHSV